MAFTRLLLSALLLVVVHPTAWEGVKASPRSLLAAKYLGEPTCCPKSPFEFCDFFFDGYDHVVPTFHLADGYNGDHVLSPILAKNFHWSGSLFNFAPGVKSVKLQTLVNVADTYQNATFLSCKKLPPWVQAGNQFYLASGGSNVGKLWTRYFNNKTKGKKGQHGQRWYRNRCVLLPITNAAVPTASGKLIKLSVNDKNVDFPQRRRCVVFKTSA